MFLPIRILIVSCLIARAYSSACPKAPEPGKDFDITKFAGRWYEIVRSIEFTEKGLSCVTADYDLNENGTFNTTNSGLRSGKRATEYGEAAHPPNAPANVLGLKSGNIPLFIPFYIVDTDFDNYAVAYTCIGIGSLIHYETAWIFSRNNTLDATLTQKLRQELVNKYGVTDSSLEMTQQKGCEYLPRH